VAEYLSTAEVARDLELNQKKAYSRVASRSPAPGAHLGEMALSELMSNDRVSALLAFLVDELSAEARPLHPGDSLEMLGQVQPLLTIPGAPVSACAPSAPRAVRSSGEPSRRGGISMEQRRWIVTVALAVGFALGALPAAAAQKEIILATTTSTQDSGLLDVLIPMFEKQSGYFVKTISVGSGQAMAMGRRGEADVLLVHAPAEEQKVVEEGAGVHRRLVMHNDFVVVGPPEDPARIRGASSAKEALTRIARSSALFLSRGDNSGTHSKEKGLWKAAGLQPDGQKWYQQTGLGMGDTLNVASEKSGYTLTDRGTYLARDKARRLRLAILVEREPLLLNVYHVIEVNPARWPRVNANGAKAFADFIVSPGAQQVIGRFGVDKVGAPLFFPDAGKPEPGGP
jgi:tungstate transport system substrate-binding protein